MIPLAKNIKRYFSLKEIAIVLLAITISVSAGVGVFLNLKNDVVIDVDGKQITVKTMKTTAREVLEQNAVTVNAYDYISVNGDDKSSSVLEKKLQKLRKNNIHIKKAVPVKIVSDGQEKTLMTYRDTVREALDGTDFKLNEKDRLDGLSLDDKIARDMTIKVIRVREEIVNDDTPVPFNVLNKENNRLDKGVERVAREGKEGVREKSFKVVYEDGIEIARQLMTDSIISAPIDKIIEFGTILNYKTSRGEILRYSKVLKMRATAYTASYADTGKNPGDPGFGITYTGTMVKKGTIAVDPRVIPLGARVFVEVAGDTPDYGYAVAADIGGAIKGNLIDLYFDSQKTVDNWGCKNVKVYVLINQ
jgi:uncharacterized protein YabE (DUF348 family)